MVGRRRRPPEVSSIGLIMIAIVGKTIGSVKAGHVCKVIELPPGARESPFLAVCAEVSSISRVFDQRKRRCALASCHTDYTCQRVRAVKHTVRSAHHFNFVEASDWQVSELDL